MHYICVNKLPISYDTVYSIIPTRILDAFKAMLLKDSSFWDVKTCHCVIQKSRGVEVRNVCIIEPQSYTFFHRNVSCLLSCDAAASYSVRNVFASLRCSEFADRVRRMFYLTQIEIVTDILLQDTLHSNMGRITLCIYLRVVFQVSYQFN
jgi:hypothetical protein